MMDDWPDEVSWPEPLDSASPASDPFGSVWHDGWAAGPLEEHTDWLAGGHGAPEVGGQVGGPDHPSGAESAGPEFGSHPEDPTAGDLPGYGGEPAGAGPDEVSPFPPRLDLGVHPLDGREWVDVALLGDPAGADAPPASDPPVALLADLHRADRGAGAPSWSAVARSDDPAVRALGLRWRPR